MKRDDFIKIIKLRSCWKIDRRKGNYTLPSGDKLSNYISTLVESQLDLDRLYIAKDGDIYPGSSENSWGADITIFIPFAENEVVEYEKHEQRIARLVNEIIG